MSSRPRRRWRSLSARAASRPKRPTRYVPATAAGVTEMIVCLLTIRDNVLPPTINYENPDPDCDLDYIPNQAREARCDYALNNSFGFGGQNISVVVGRYRD